MGRWKEDETEFTVNLNHDKRQGCIAIIPKHVIEKLGEPDQVKFIFKGKNEIKVQTD